jgi:hypothetical protein
MQSDFGHKPRMHACSAWLENEPRDSSPKE